MFRLFWDQAQSIKLRLWETLSWLMLSKGTEGGGFGHNILMLSKQCGIWNMTWEESQADSFWPKLLHFLHKGVLPYLNVGKGAFKNLYSMQEPQNNLLCNKNDTDKSKGKCRAWQLDTSFMTRWYGLIFVPVTIRGWNVLRRWIFLSSFSFILFISTANISWQWASKDH